MNKLDVTKTDWNNPAHCMLDLETLGTGQDAVLLSISAVQFNPFTGETFKEFEVFLDLDSQIAINSTITQGTILWWLAQDTAVRNQVIKKCKNGQDITSALKSFSAYIKQNDIKFVYGKGPSFDNAKLNSAYERTKLEAPFKYYNDRCVRTIIALDSEVKNLEFIGNRHNGIDDSKHQIRQVHTNLIKIYEIPEIPKAATVNEED